VSRDDTAVAAVLVEVAGEGTAWTGTDVGRLVALMGLLLVLGIALLILGRRPKGSAAA
jgi:LPXTG-motif cell wall-anchored protein